ncbi:Gfo/Idh/MocA family oxidoreductase [Acuticoccus sp. MNP-M23]|uniref:Gfo/Idh/MocA family protein n=1 Tax=Acuticoccus sp. MNP-M23 TaxID=3072793 RepID=UPI0028153B39|nr:Gfo/Idh/MocA family oxidoreductase [Acuticoccus sp. MNP-M23]WMS41978.1 Gfo/Idh/MocA family oxidoreductase [Acuticoccus sp. MNP-M23]
MSDPYRGVLIGCGFFARNHMHGWADANGAAIVAVCDRERAKAEAFAADFGIARFYTDAAEMLAAETPDFADVATTVETHRPLVELCLGHGAATVCQKPFAETHADGKAMVDAAEAAGKPLIIHENFRWQRPFMALKERLEAGDIGAPTFARLAFRHGYDVYANQPYLAKTERFAIMDVGLHLFDVDRFLLGDVVDIHCRTQSIKPGIAGEDAFIATVRHESGVVASIECSFASKIAPDPFPQTLVWLEGTEGTLEVTGDYRLRLHRNGTVQERDVEPDVPAWGAAPWHAVQASVAAFEAHVVDVLAGRAAPQPSGAHNLTTLAMALAAYRSAETGSAVNINEFVAGGAL